ncbi:uncharacterized protein J8A68_000206 [[Candida] subhashii]|uniref:Uncharacterized protein n=1 Tax=[Candida] subhashii TaxID=561895 RepID=A0A8J5QRM6_9ASCO|nr:uncharacterized protein J8A68_000206 [[Candida] subhashii]KAG7666253.1 hypothetical protein J8A68_000206 [[Candida] subhashii]
MQRFFSTSAKRCFQKDTITSFMKPSIPKQASHKMKATQASPSKWNPTNGNSFRSFAEYRLKATNQSPLGVRARLPNLYSSQHHI